jgi:hypothetical protein
MRVRKSLAALIAAVGILPLFTGCDISADFWDERKFAVDIPADGEKKVTGNEQAVDIGSHSEIADKLDQLQDLDISEIWVEIPKVYSETNKATKASGKLKAKGPNAEDQWIDIGSYTDLAITEGGKIQIIPDAAVTAQLKDWALHGSHKFFVTYEAEMDEVPAKFDVKARLHIVASVGFGL